MTIEYHDIPRSFRQSEFVEARHRMLHESHIAPLTAYVKSLRAKHPDWEFQDFDPMDGGIDADMLFLLEKPGPMTSPQTKRKGSGFISRNNDDSTAEALFRFMQQAGIDRKRVVLWNVIPGWNGTIKIKTGERHAGVEELANLMKLLPRLKTVVLVGRQAGKAERLMLSMNVKIFMSAHPSPKVRNMNRAMWDLIPEQWAEASRVHQITIC
ncbi:uracil-DNA glycosylase [Collimonas sp. NPDC087041]|uniref:uracil-DNA glycosylase n=1 Tax=Collimonas sp. NPDC087041 TaxID=3363960 RepID=UPI00380D6681